MGGNEPGDLEEEETVVGPTPQEVAGKLSN